MGGSLPLSALPPPTKPRTAQCLYVPVVSSSRAHAKGIASLISFGLSIVSSRNALCFVTINGAIMMVRVFCLPFKHHLQESSAEHTEGIQRHAE